MGPSGVWRFGSLTIMVVALAVAHPASAQTPPVHYATGWNMVGGPVGVDLSPAEARYAYVNGSYNPAAGISSPCDGLWAYFSAPVDMVVPGSSVTTQSCTVPAGWAIVGNPFTTPAVLPAGVIGYRWDPSTAAYVTGTVIPVGSATWIFSTTSGSIQLQTAPQGDVTIAVPPPPAEPIRLHVGEYLTVLVSQTSAGPGWLARADPVYFQQVSSGPVVGTTGYAYRWRASTAGNATITLDPACLPQGCRIPSFSISVTITA